MISMGEAICIAITLLIVFGFGYFIGRMHNGGNNE